MVQVLIFGAGSLPVLVVLWPVIPAARSVTSAIKSNVPRVQKPLKKHFQKSLFLFVLTVEKNEA